MLSIRVWGQQGGISLGSDGLVFGIGFLRSEQRVQMSEVIFFGSFFFCLDTEFFFRWQYLERVFFSGIMCMFMIVLFLQYVFLKVGWVFFYLYILFSSYCSLRVLKLVFLFQLWGWKFSGLVQVFFLGRTVQVFLGFCGCSIEFVFWLVVSQVIFNFGGFFVFVQKFLVLSQ